MAQDNAERIIDFMRNSGSKLPNGSNLFGMLNPCFHFFLLCNIFDITDHAFYFLCRCLNRVKIDEENLSSAHYYFAAYGMIRHGVKNEVQAIIIEYQRIKNYGVRVHPIS